MKYINKKIYNRYKNYIFTFIKYKYSVVLTSNNNSIFGYTKYPKVIVCLNMLSDDL
jgi:hypothetical protein